MARTVKSAGIQSPGAEAVTRVTRLPALPASPPEAHKGTFGRALIIAGSRGMLGAPSLTAHGALRAGAGLVTIACPESIQIAVGTLCPCATTLPLPETAGGMLDPRKSLAALERRGLLGPTTHPDVVAIGPGIDQSNDAFARDLISLIQKFDGKSGIPIVLDADALNAVARANLPKNSRLTWPLSTQVVITPHPGEMARLHGRPTRYVTENREQVAVATAEMIAANSSNRPAKALEAAERPVVVLKGAGTIVTDGRRIFINKTGNPGMATGGAGDVLTGVIAALIGRGMPRFDAAVLGVHVHGLAGDIAASNLGQISLTASDLIDALSAAFRTAQVNRPVRVNSKPKSRRSPSLK